MVNAGLRYFAAVARHRSIREAAEELHIAQSALSRQIHKLEEDFGVPLFHRHARGVELTSAGEIFLRHARSSLRQIERVRSELDALKGLRRGTVTIQSIESLVQHLLPRAIARFSERHPGISFDVTIDGSDHVVAAVLKLMNLFEHVLDVATIRRRKIQHDLRCFGDHLSVIFKQLEEAIVLGEQPTDKCLNRHSLRSSEIEPKRRGVCLTRSDDTSTKMSCGSYDRGIPDNPRPHRRPAGTCDEEPRRRGGGL